MRLEVCRTTDVDRYITERHYLHSTPAGARLRLWVQDENGATIGAMMWGRPTARTFSPTRIMELTRLFWTIISATAPKAGRWQWRESISASIFPRSRGLSPTHRRHRDIRERSIQRTDGSRWAAQGRAHGAKRDERTSIRHIRRAGYVPCRNSYKGEDTDGREIPVH